MDKVIVETYLHLFESKVNTACNNGWKIKSLSCSNDGAFSNGIFMAALTRNDKEKENK